MIHILQKDEPLLRKKAVEVPLADIGGAKLKKVLRDMWTTLLSQDDGVALAAPQIGVSLRLFIVSKAALGKSPLTKGVLHSDAGGLSKKNNPPRQPPLLRGITTPASEDGGTPFGTGETTPVPHFSEKVGDTPFGKGDRKAAGFMVFINPVITKLSKDKTLLDEGCLSVRPLYGKIKRSKKATITACDEEGHKFTRGASGLLAQIFQHECDHLDGVLFIDTASELKELPAPSSDS